MNRRNLQIKNKEKKMLQQSCLKKSLNKRN